MATRTSAVKTVQNASMVLDDHLKSLDHQIREVRARAFDKYVFVPSAPVEFSSMGVYGGHESGWKPSNKARSEFLASIESCRAAMPPPGVPEEDPRAATRPVVDLLLTIRKTLAKPGAREELEEYDRLKGTNVLAVCEQLEGRWARTKYAWRQALHDVDNSLCDRGATAHLALGLRILAFRQFVMRKVRPRLAIVHDLFNLAGSTKGAAKQITISIPDVSDISVMHVRFAAPPRHLFGGRNICYIVHVSPNHPLLPPKLYVVNRNFEKGPCPIVHPNIDPETGEFNLIGLWQWPVKSGSVMNAVMKAAQLLEDPDITPRAVRNPTAAALWADPSPEARKAAMAATALSASGSPAAAEAAAASGLTQASATSATGDFCTSSAEIPPDATLLATLLTKCVAALVDRVRRRRETVRVVQTALKAVAEGAIAPAAAVAAVEAKLRATDPSVAPSGKTIPFGLSRRVDKRAAAALQRTQSCIAAADAAQGVGGDEYAQLLRSRTSARLQLSASSTELSSQHDSDRALHEMGRLRRSITAANPGLLLGVQHAVRLGMGLAAPAEPTLMSPTIAAQPAVLGAMDAADDPRSPSAGVYRAPPQHSQAAESAFASHFAHLANSDLPPPVPRGTVAAATFHQGPAKERLALLKAAPTTAAVKTVAAVIGDGSDAAAGHSTVAAGVASFLSAQERIGMQRVCSAWHKWLGSDATRAAALQSVAARASCEDALLEREIALLTGRLEVMSTAEAALSAGA